MVSYTANSKCSSPSIEQGDGSSLQRSKRAKHARDPVLRSTETATPPVVTPAGAPTNGFVSADKLLITFEEAMGEQPSDPGTAEDLSNVLAREESTSAPPPCPRQASIEVNSSEFESDSTSDEEFEIVAPTSINSNSNRNYVYGHRFACQYIMTAFFGKNGAYSEKKVYDKEFMDHLQNSFDQRARAGPAGWSDNSLLCVKLGIHAVGRIRIPDSNEARAETFKGGSMYHNLFIRVLSKREVKEGLNTDDEILLWLDRIRDAFQETRARYPFRITVGGIIGKSKSDSRALDEVMMDPAVVEYAKMFFGKKIANGSFFRDHKRMKMFFSDRNKALDLLN